MQHFTSLRVTIELSVPPHHFLCSLSAAAPSYVQQNFLPSSRRAARSFVDLPPSVRPSLVTCARSPERAVILLPTHSALTPLRSLETRLNGRSLARSLTARGLGRERESFVGVNLTATAVAVRRRRVYFAAFLFLSRTKAIRPAAFTRPTLLPFSRSKPRPRAAIADTSTLHSRGGGCWNPKNLIPKRSPWSAPEINNDS